MPFNKPSDAVSSVLSRLRIDPDERFNEEDQDIEYTACRAAEIPDYFRLYTRENVTSDEKDVLCCFLLEGLNESIQVNAPHPLQGKIFEALFSTDRHAAELAYWMDTSDPNEEHWWPITKALLQYRGLD